MEERKGCLELGKGWLELVSLGGSHLGLGQGAWTPPTGLAGNQEETVLIYPTHTPHPALMTLALLNLLLQM